MTKSSRSLSQQHIDLLKQVKKQIGLQSPTASSSTQTMPKDVSSSKMKHHQVEHDETYLFAQAMQGVTPIETDTVPSRPKRIRPDAQTLAKRLAAQGQEEQSQVGLSDMQALLNPVASEAFLSYRVTTLQHRVFEQLKQGKLRWYEAVDLHGCTIEQAREAVIQLLQLAKAAQENVVKIVHGKGEGGILKTCVNGWLRQHPDVLAFVSTPNHQGGTGSVFVLIKRAERTSKETARVQPR